MRNTIVIAILISISILTALMVLIPSTDDFDPSNPLWNGMSIATNYFRIGTIDLSTQSIPTTVDVLLIVGPDTPFTPSEIEKIRRFVASGGTLIVFDDFGTGIDLLNKLGIHVEIYRGILTDPLRYFRSYRFPVAKVLNTSVVLNYATAIARAGARCIGLSSPFSYMDLDLDNEPDANEPRGPLCIAIEKRIGRGLVVFVSDADIAINAMISHNMEFLEKLLRGRDIAIAVNHWRHTLYTLARNIVVESLRLCVYTSIRYPLAAALGIAMYVAATRIAEKKRHVPSDIELDKLIKRILAKHPTWSYEELKRIARDVLCRRSPSSRS